MEDQKKKLFLSQNQTEKTEAALKVQGRYSEMFSGLPSNGALPFYLSNGGRGYGCMGLAFGRPPEMALVASRLPLNAHILPLTAKATTILSILCARCPCLCPVRTKPSSDEENPQVLEEVVSPRKLRG